MAQQMLMMSQYHDLPRKPQSHARGYHQIPSPSSRNNSHKQELIKRFRIQKEIAQKLPQLLRVIIIDGRKIIDTMEEHEIFLYQQFMTLPADCELSPKTTKVNYWSLADIDMDAGDYSYFPSASSNEDAASDIPFYTGYQTLSPEPVTDPVPDENEMDIEDTMPRRGRRGAVAEPSFQGENPQTPRGKRKEQEVTTGPTPTSGIYPRGTRVKGRRKSMQEGSSKGERRSYALRSKQNHSEDPRSTESSPLTPVGSRSPKFKQNRSGNSGYLTGSTDSSPLTPAASRSPTPIDFSPPDPSMSFDPTTPLAKRSRSIQPTPKESLESPHGGQGDIETSPMAFEAPRDVQSSSSTLKGQSDVASSPIALGDFSDIRQTPKAIGSMFDIETSPIAFIDANSPLTRKSTLIQQQSSEAKEADELPGHVQNSLTRHSKDIQRQSSKRGELPGYIQHLLSSPMASFDTSAIESSPMAPIDYDSPLAHRSSAFYQREPPSSPSVRRSRNYDSPFPDARLDTVSYIHDNLEGSESPYSFRDLFAASPSTPYTGIGNQHGREPMTPMRLSRHNASIEPPYERPERIAYISSLRNRRGELEAQLETFMQLAVNADPLNVGRISKFKLVGRDDKGGCEEEEFQETLKREIKKFEDLFTRCREFGVEVCQGLAANVTAINMVAGRMVLKPKVLPSVFDQDY